MPPQLARVLVVGTSGSGKTTLARSLATRLGLAHCELDRLFWQPGWQPRAKEEFRQLAAQASSGPRWVMDGNYGSVREYVWPRATHAIWLNYAFPLVIWQVTRRSLARIIDGREIFPGCRETVAKSFFSRSSVIWWAITTYAERKRHYASMRREQTYPQVSWLEFRSPRETRRFLEALGPGD